MLQENLKNKNMTSFEDRLKLLRKKLKKETMEDREIVHNHFPGNGLLGNKKALFLCLQ